MKKVLFSFFLSVFVVSIPYLPEGFAQDYTRWSLPESAKFRLGKGRVNDITYSPDGTLLAVASSIGIWLYNTATLQEEGLFTGKGWTWGVTFSPDGKTLVSTGNYGIELWDIETSTHKRTLKGHTVGIGNPVFSSDGQTLATGGSWIDKTIHLWDVDTGEHKRTLKGHDGGIAGIVFSPDGESLTTASIDKTIRLWDVDTSKHKKTQGRTQRTYRFRQ